MQVGRYQLHETLGVGAHSRVVRGHDPLIDRSVAIKLFSPELGRGEGRARFLREARVVGKLSHPFIISLHDMGIETGIDLDALVECAALARDIVGRELPSALLHAGPRTRKYAS